MKAENFILINKEVRAAAITRLLEFPLDGKTQVVFSGLGTKTARQRKLDYKWDSEILKSGIGWGDKTIDQVHARGKWLFARPILLMDDEIFVAIYDHFMAHYGKDKEKCLKFAQDYISTERLSTAQAAEYMSNKQNYWTSKGVILTDPSLQGLDFTNDLKQ